MVPSQNEKDLWFCYTLVGCKLDDGVASPVLVGESVKIALFVNYQNNTPKNLFL